MLLFFSPAVHKQAQYTKCDPSQQSGWRPVGFNVPVHAHLECSDRIRTDYEIGVSLKVYEKGAVSDEVLWAQEDKDVRVKRNTQHRVCNF
jgi:hypothetical protein